MVSTAWGKNAKTIAMVRVGIEPITPHLCMCVCVCVRQCVCQSLAYLAYPRDNSGPVLGSPNTKFGPKVQNN